MLMFPLLSWVNNDHTSAKTGIQNRPTTNQSTTPDVISVSALNVSVGSSSQVTKDFLLFLFSHVCWRNTVFVPLPRFASLRASAEGWPPVQNIPFPLRCHQTVLPQTTRCVSLPSSLPPPPDNTFHPSCCISPCLFFRGTVVCYYPSFSPVIRLTSRFREGKIAFA